MTVTHELVIAHYEYQVGDQTKTRWLKCGRIFEDDVTGKLKVKIDSIPTGQCAPDGNEEPWSGWFHVFDAKDNSTSARDQPRNKPRTEKGKTTTGENYKPNPNYTEDDAPF